MFRPVLSVYEVPVTAVTNEAQHYIDTEDPAHCPFAEHYIAARLHDTQSYIDHTPEIGSPAGLGEGQTPIPSQTAQNLAILLSVALKDVIRLYRPAYAYLEQRSVPESDIVRVVRQSLPMAHHYGSLRADDADKLRRLAAKNPEKTFVDHQDKDNTITSINFAPEIISGWIKERRMRGFGCSILGLVIKSNQDGKNYNVFNLYWDALVVQAHEAIMSDEAK